MAQVVAVLGGDSAAGRALTVLDLSDFEVRHFADAADPALRSLVNEGGRLVDLSGGVRVAPEGLPAPLLVALPALGWDRLQDAAHLLLPSAGAAAAVLAAVPLLQAGLFEPDTVTLLVSGGGRVQELASPLADEIAAGIRALGLASPRLIANVVSAPIGSCVLAVVSGLLTSADAADPAVMQKSLDEFPIDPSLRICPRGELPDLARVAGTAVAEVAAAPSMLAERVTAACALDSTTFLAQAVLTALRASG